MRLDAEDSRLDDGGPTMGAYKTNPQLEMAPMRTLRYSSQLFRIDGMSGSQRIRTFSLRVFFESLFINGG